MGRMGPRGSVGESPEGPKGDSGIRGPKGVRGPAGVRGQPGKGSNIPMKQSLDQGSKSRQKSCAIFTGFTQFSRQNFGRAR